jgi:hypothetical protein
MDRKTFTLTARVSTENPQVIKLALEELISKSSITPTDEGFLVKATLREEDVRELNRTLLCHASSRAEDPFARRMDVGWHYGTFL